MLYQLLRLEFVKTYRTPLCSDSFTGFVTFESFDLPLEFCLRYTFTINRFKLENKKENNQAVKEATKYLLEHVVPAFATKLPHIMIIPGKTGCSSDTLNKSANEACLPEQEHFDELVILTHQRGVNLRSVKRKHITF